MKKLVNNAKEIVDVSDYLIFPKTKIPVYSTGKTVSNTKYQNWYKNKRVYVVDYGSKKRKFFILNCYAKKFSQMSIEEFLKFPKNHKNSIIIVEYAHLKSSEGISLAQPLSAEQKQIFLNNCKLSNVCLKFFPENKTPKARCFAEKIHSDLSKKSDMHDVIAIYLYVKYFPNIYSTLSETDSIDSNIVKEAQRFRIETNIILNKGRYNDYKDDYISNFIEKHKESLYKHIENIPKALGILNITKDKKNNIKLNIKVLYTILATLVDNEGNIRKRESTGQIPGWEYISNREFCLNHNKGEVSKSNLNYHFFRHAFAREHDFSKITKKGKKGKSFDRILNFNKNQYEEFTNYRKLVKKILKDLFLYFKEKLLVEQTGFRAISYKIHSNM